ncbi:MAG: flippase [archaeon]|nr:flippase [archaeon]
MKERMKRDKNNLSEVAAKGSIYNILSLVILKLGGLIFTIILARILLPELFGVYALVLSVFTIVMTFTDLGISTASVRYISDSLGRRNKKMARSYVRYFFKRKLILIFIAVVALLGISKYLSFSIYQNPLIYYPLIFSCLFIISESFREFFGFLFVARKDLKPNVFFDLISQLSKIVFSVIALLIFATDFKISGIFIAFFISSFITSLISFFVLRRKDKEILFGHSEKIKDKSKVNTYWKYMAIATLSLAFFGSIDTLMLGGFVSTEYLGYYRAALSLILAIAAIFPLSSIFLPIFTQINKKRFVRGFQKTIRYLLIFSIPATMGVVFIAKHLIFLIYGEAYLPATSSVYFLSLLVITSSLISLYSTVLESKERPKIVGYAVLISLAFNVILNYAAIKIFMKEPLMVIAGVGFATVLSRTALLLILVFYSRKYLGLKIKGIGLRVPILSTVVMSMFLYAFNQFIDINLFTGIIEIILGAGIYFGVLVWLGGLNKDDWDLLKTLIRKN